MARKLKNDVKITPSSGNVFSDLGFRDAEDRQTKVKLAVALNRILAAMKLSQIQAAKLLGVNQPKVSALKHYRLAGFSVERLIGFVTALNCDVEIVIRFRARSAKAGRITVSAA